MQRQAEPDSEEALESIPLLALKDIDPEAEKLPLEEKEEAKRKKKAAAQRKRHLKQVAAKEKNIWREVESLLETTYQKNYDRAVQWLQDMRDVAAMSSAADQWEGRVAKLRRRHARKSSLMKRFDAAGFPS